MVGGVIFPAELQKVAPHAKDRWPKILEKARALVEGERRDDYGTPEESMQRIAVLWAEELRMPISPARAARLMQLLKLARLKKSPHHEDSLVDYAGWGLIREELETR